MSVPKRQFMASGDHGDFRRALGRFVTGVTVVTARAGGGQPVGLTVNSFNALSLKPPLILWSLALTSRTLPVFRDADRFAVHVLAHQQEDLARRFAMPRVDRFADLEATSNGAGPPLIEGCVARFECRTVTRRLGGDHLLFIGEVEEFLATEKSPLVFFAGAFGSLFEARD